MARIHIHLPKDLLLYTPPGGTGFYKRLHAALIARGDDVEFVRRMSIVAGPDFGPDAFHFVHQGLVRQANALNTGIAYIQPFWYVDRNGIFGESAIGAEVFDPAAIDMEEAQAFFDRLSRRLIGRRLTKYAQPGTSPRMPSGAVAVFLQGSSIPVRRAQFMSETQMLEAIVEGVPDRTILIKPHPRNVDAVTLRHARRLAKAHARVKIVDAHVHDMLAAADVTCSISSSVSIEGFVHAKPALLFGKTDFHHIAHVVEQPGDVPAALDAALADTPPYAAFLYWFLQTRCINMGRDDWFDRITARMAGAT